MTTLSTHDTKRGEDVRARLAVLAELPRRWAELVTGWMAAAPLPDAALAHLLWQTAVGAWPIERERLHAYAEKAAREAAASTSWTDPDPAFEQAMHALVDRHVRRPGRCSLGAGRVRRRDHPGRLVQLARPEAGPARHARGARHLPGHRAVGQLPGRPGQPPAGRLRRTPGPAGPARRRLAAGGGRRPARPSCSWSPGPCAPRRDRPELFGGYQPVIAHGPAAGHAVAFDRGGAVAVATRLPLRLAATGGWRDTTLSLPVNQMSCLFTGRVYSDNQVRLTDLLATYPVALLVPTT